MEVKIYPTKLEVARRFAKYLAELCESQKEVHIALSGGSTPRIIFEELAANYRESIPWSRIHFYWGDERCVPPGHPESNYGMTREHLLSQIHMPEENIHRVMGENPPEEEAARYAGLLGEILPKKYRVPNFDLVILGLGEDGHTASIFPHEISLWEASAYCEVASHPESGQKRITLTGKVINNATRVAFLVTGAGKAEKVQEILQQKGNYERYPASRVAPRSGNLFWFLDKEAAEGII
jgi:6-phosphogluconolactonase